MPEERTQALGGIRKVSGSYNPEDYLSEETSKDDHERLDTFAGIMPNSRINSTVNQDVVKTTVTPVTAAYAYKRTEPAETKNPYTTYLPIAFAAVAVLLIIGEILTHRRKGKKEKKEKKRVW